MPQIDFYIIADLTPQGHCHFACRLIEKAYQRGHKIFVNCGTQAEMHLLDELLWTFKDASFIPHNIIGEGPLPPPAVQLGHQQQPHDCNDILINLATPVPIFHTHFRRIIEIISQDPTIKHNGRERYKFYRDQGTTPTTHDIKS